jgi:hypothetical protein
VGKPSSGCGHRVVSQIDRQGVTTIKILRLDW